MENDNHPLKYLRRRKVRATPKTYRWLWVVLPPAALITYAIIRHLLH